MSQFSPSHLSHGKDNSQKAASRNPEERDAEGGRGTGVPEKEGAEDGQQGTAEADSIPPLATRLMLCAELLGGEAGISFSQLYAIPNLQMLGMPISLVSLTGLISGPIATVLLALIGWFSDTGSNPTFRRMLMVIMATTILTTGALTVITANLLHSQLCRSETLDSRNSSSLTLETRTLPGVEYNQTACKDENCSVIPTSSENPIPGNVSLSSISTLGSNTDMELDTSSPSVSSADCFPDTAAVAMLGFILMELGYDTSMSTIKTWMLTCNPPCGASSILVAGLVLTSIGGMLTAGMGMVNLASELGVSSLPPLTVQTTIQASVVVVMLVVGMVITLLTGHRLLRQRRLVHRQQDDHLQKEHVQTDTSQPEWEIIVEAPESSNGHTDQAKWNTPPTESAEFCSHLPSGSSSKPKPALKAEPGNEASSLISNAPDADGTSRNSLRDCEQLPDNVARTPISYGALGTPTSEPTMAPALTGSHTDVTGSQRMLLTDDSRPSCCSWRRRFGFKTTIVIIWLSAYFGIGAITVTSLTVSDFVGKAICNGDPGAPEGSEALERYQDGLRMAAYGVLVNYGVYLAFSFVQKRVLALLGYTLEFVTMTLLLCASLVLLALTQRLETFFLMSAVAGIHKAVFHVVPISVVSDLVHAEAERRGDGGGLRMGGALSLMVGALPMAYMSLFSWVGAVINLTDALATPLLLATLYGVLSAVFCLSLGL